MTEEPNDEFHDARPHSKPFLTTRIGQFVDKAAYVDIILSVLFIFSISSVYFTFAPPDHGLSSNGEVIDVSFPDSVYFSLVTFTSLGYGDMAPVGFGRFVASMTVVVGLSFFALIIGKIASERTHATLTLLHRSDVQRRLSAFSSEIESFRSDLDKLAENGEDKLLRQRLKDLQAQTSAASGYLVFNLHQSVSLYHGNNSGITRLFSEQQKLQETLISLHKRYSQSGEDSVLRRSLNIASILPWTSNYFIEHLQAGDPARSYAERILAYGSRFIRGNNRESQTPNIPKSWLETRERMKLNIDELTSWRRTNYTSDLQNKVYEALPAGPKSNWPKDTNKKISLKLNISIKATGRYIDRLTNNGSIPK
ncbi:potassium channel family protein [Thioclava sp. 'Guangxiensis']|uniref:potassium channel family protein n=1 Tax=Thioclava sp. 'Guangxiensis' TaxID=3149044 RepID=UPI0038781D9D